MVAEKLRVVAVASALESEPTRVSFARRLVSGPLFSVEAPSRQAHLPRELVASCDSPVIGKTSLPGGRELIFSD